MSASPGGGVIIPPLPPLPPLSSLPTKSPPSSSSSSAAATAAATAAAAAVAVAVAGSVTQSNQGNSTSILNSTVSSLGSTNEGAEARAIASAAVSEAAAATEAAAAEAYSLPYIVITGLKASIDSSIDQYVKDAADRMTLKEVPVNAGSSAGENKQAPTTTSKFTLADGEFPKLQVDLYEQMVYHRSTSINMNPLEILVPTRYKIDHKKIMQYFSVNASDEATKTLVSSVVSEYGENNNSLFYKHTISGKSNSTGLNLDKKTHDLIESRIEKWHNDYSGWIFYDTSSRFFLQNQELPKDELITLKIELNGVLDNDNSTNGIQTLVKSIGNKYNALLNLYTKNGEQAVLLFTNTLVPFITFYKLVFDDIKNHMNDQLNFITNRKENMGNAYEFNDTIKASMFKTFEEVKMMLDNLGDVKMYPTLTYFLL